MMLKSAGLALALLLLGCATPSPQPGPTAPAAAPPAALRSLRVVGVVTALNPHQLTIETSSGPVNVRLPLFWYVGVVAPIEVNAIRPGSFIGTANRRDASGVGTSIEVHVFPPGVHLGEGDRDWDDGARMTNGTVGTVVQTPSGREIDVSYRGGRRHIVVPADVPVVSITQGKHRQIHVGTLVSVRATQSHGGLIAQFAVISADGSAPTL